MISFIKRPEVNGFHTIDIKDDSGTLGSLDYVIEPPTLTIHYVHVAVTNRENGIGESLLNLVKDEAVKARCLDIAGDFKPHSDGKRCRRFYESNGFSIDEEGNLICSL